MGLKLANNAISVLASSLTAGATSVALATGTGSRFPSLGAGDYFPATISKSDGTFEIVRVTARSGDTLTVTRAQESTTALAFDAGCLVELRLTAATIDSINLLAGDALARSGGTMTGDLTMGVGTKIVMEGTTDDAFETTIDPGNPTADRTLTLPNKSGTLATTDDMPQAFPSGTRMLFQQTSAPTGWTKDTTHNDKALRVVSGTAGSGGSVAFSTAFASGLSAGSTTLSTSQMPSHSHTANVFAEGYNGGGGTGRHWPRLESPQYNETNTNSIQNTGSGGSHTHTLPSFAVQYVDLIIASKD